MFVPRIGLVNEGEIELLIMMVPDLVMVVL